MRNISSLFRRSTGHANHRVLGLVEAVVRALGGEQLRVRAVLDDLAVIDVEDLVRVLDGAADIFLEMVTQPFPGFDGIVQDSSNQATV